MPDLGSLRPDQAYGAERSPIEIVFLVSGQPLKEVSSRLLPARIFRIASQPGLPRDHAAGGGLRQPHAHFHGGLAGMAPDGVAHVVSAGDVRRGAAAHEAVTDTALLRAVPHGRRAAAILMIGVHPAADSSNLLDVDFRPDAAAQIADVHTVGTPLSGGILP